MGKILAVNVLKANQHDTKGGIFVFEKALFLYPKINAEWLMKIIRDF